MHNINEFSRSGMMFYFDIIPAISSLDRGDRGDLFLASMVYGESGVEPEFSGETELVWLMLKPRLDYDEERYVKTILQRKYAAYRRGMRKEKGEDAECMSFDEWKEMFNFEQRIIPFNENNSRYPYTNTDTESESNTDTESDTKSESESYLYSYSNTDTDTDTKTSHAVEPQNTHKFIRPTLEEVKEYCRSRGNLVNAELFFSFYESNGWKTGRNPMKDWKASVRCWEIKNKEKLEANGNKIRTEEDYMAYASECL